jgi:hypothetical protein
MSHFFDLEFDQRVICRVSILGLTRLAKIKIWASAALETNASDGRLLASITRDTTVNNLSADRLSKFQQRMLSRMHRGSLTLGTQIEIGADSTIVPRTHDRKHVASITSDVTMCGRINRDIFARRLRLRCLALKPKIKWTAREISERCKSRSE